MARERKKERKTKSIRSAKPPRGRQALRIFLWFSAGLGAALAVSLGGRLLVRRGGEAAVLSPEIEMICQKAYDDLTGELYSEAVLGFEKAAKMAPRDPRPYLGLGKVYRMIDMDELATDAYRKALERDPDYQGARVSLAMVLCDFGKNEEAIALLRDAEAKAPEDPFLWAELGINSMKLGKPKEAIPYLEKYNRAEGKQAWGLSNLGRAHAEAGNTEAAEKAYREALAINPRSVMANLWLGQLLVATGRAAEAEERLKAFQDLRSLQTQARLLEQAIGRSPDNVPALVRLAQVRHLLGQTKEALVPIQRACELAPGDEKIGKLREDLFRAAGVQKR